MAFGTGGGIAGSINISFFFTFFFFIIIALLLFFFI